MVINNTISGNHVEKAIEKALTDRTFRIITNFVTRNSVEIRYRVPIKSLYVRPDILDSFNSCSLHVSRKSLVVPSVRNYQFIFSLEEDNKKVIEQMKSSNLMNPTKDFRARYYLVIKEIMTIEDIFIKGITLGSLSHRYHDMTKDIRVKLKTLDLYIQQNKLTGLIEGKRFISDEELIDEYVKSQI